MTKTVFNILAPWLCCTLFLSGSTLQAAETGGIGRSLQDFFTAALEFSPRLQIAEENLNIGGARKQAATGRLLPQLSASASRSENRQVRAGQVTEFGGRRYSLQLSQVLFNWQAFAARRRSSLVEDQRESEYYFELSTLLTQVAEAYFNVLQAQDALTSIESEIDALRNQLEQVQSRYDRQLAQITDLYLARSSLASAEADQLRLENERALAQEDLRSVTGLEVGELLTLSDTAEVPGVDESIQYWVELARENNQQIRARELALRAAEELVSESRGAYYPQVNLVAQQRDSNQGFDNIFIPRNETSYLGLNVEIPLYSGGTNRASVREARSSRNIAESELVQTELDARQRVRAAYLQVQSNQALTAASESVLESATLSSEAMQEGFRLGVVTSVDVLNALRDQFQAERDLQQARYEHIKNLLFLKREAGTLTAEDMIEVGNWLENPEQ